MKKAKRIFSVLLTFAMLLSACSFVCMAEETTIAAASEEDIQIADKLVVLGVTEEREAEALSDFVLRRDMVAILVKYLRLSSVAVDKTASPFLDVSAVDPQIGDFHTLYNAGYISGDDTGYYRPNDNLTYNEAVTMVINAIGYKTFAERSGGYPSGYLYIANKYDMLDGLSGSGSEPIPYYDLYRLLNAGLHAAAIVVNVYDNEGNGDYVLSSEITFVEENYGMKIIEGIVTGNENTRLRAQESDRVDRNQIEIDNVVYDTPEQEYADLLGYPVTAYAKQDGSGNYEIAYLEAKLDSYYEMELSADDLLKAKTTSSRIYYLDENEKEKHINVLATMPDVIYNGKCRTGYGALQNALPDNGSVLALDNNKDNVYDILFVWEYENFAVAAYDSLSGTYVEAYTGATKTIDPDKDDVRVYTTDGNEVSLSQIERDTVISIYESANTSGYKLITIYLLEDVIQGTVEEITSNNTYIINGQEYELAKNLQDYITNSQFAGIKPNMTASFLLDVSGKIALYEVGETAADGKYGFVAGVDAKLGLSRALTLKIYTEEGKWVEAEVTNPVNIDGQRLVLNSDTAINTAAGQIVVGDVVVFATSGSKISYIDTKAPNYGNDTPLKDKGNLREITSGTDFRARNGITFVWNDATIDPFVIRDGNVIIFSVPAMGELLEDEEAYGVSNKLGKNYLGNQPTYAQYSWYQKIDSFAAYNMGVSDIDVATCVVLRGTSGGVSASSLNAKSPLVVVSKISTAINKDGEVSPKLYYYQGGAELGAIANDNIAYSYTKTNNITNATSVPFAQAELKHGDVIQISTDDDGYIDGINVIYRADQRDTTMSTVDPLKKLKELARLQYPTYNMVFDGGAEGTAQEGMAIGELQEIDVENKVLSFTCDTTKYYINFDGASASVYRASTKRVEDISFNELMQGDRIILQSTEGFNSKVAYILAIR